MGERKQEVSENYTHLRIGITDKERNVAGKTNEGGGGGLQKPMKPEPLPESQENGSEKGVYQG